MLSGNQDPREEEYEGRGRDGHQLEYEGRSCTVMRLSSVSDGGTRWVTTPSIKAKVGRE